MDAKYAHLDRVTDRLAEPARRRRPASGTSSSAGTSTSSAARTTSSGGRRTTTGSPGSSTRRSPTWTGGSTRTGYADLGRRHALGAAGPYTWWSWRGKAFDNDAGWRIDYRLASPGAAERSTAAVVDRAPAYDKRFSDHAPVVATYET